MINEFRKYNITTNTLNDGFSYWFVYNDTITYFDLLSDINIEKFIEYLKGILTVVKFGSLTYNTIDRVISSISDDRFNTVNYLKELANQNPEFTIFGYNVNKFSSKIPQNVPYIELIENKYIDKIKSDAFKKALKYLDINIEYIMFDDNVYLVNDLLNNGIRTKFYHGTCLSNLFGIAKNGIIPSPDNTNFELINHDKYVFITTSRKVALAYAKMCVNNKPYRFSFGDSSKYYNCEVVIELDYDKLDLTKLELDFDYYVNTNVNRSIKKYDDIINKSDITRSVKFVSSGFNDKKKYGYNGRILPTAIDKIYIYESYDKNKYSSYTLNEFISIYMK